MGISLLNVVGKLYARVLIRRCREGTDTVIGEKQCGFKREWGCLDQVFPVMQAVFLINLVSFCNF